MDKNLVRMSKFLSLVLRHKPEVAGLALDENGWIGIDELLAGCKTAGHMISRSAFDEIVVTNEKKRFTVEGDRVRAAQGHSVDIDLGYQPVKPPDVLYHGTATQFLDSIRKTGLQPQARQHVHLPSSLITAVDVGKRRGEAAIVAVKAKQAYEAGVLFYQADNGVWLSEEIAPQFLLTPMP